MAEGFVDQPAAEGQQASQLERALDRIGTTAAHKQILLLVLIGVLFDSFEQNTIGIAGPMLRQHWGLSVADIGILNTITFGAAATGRLLSGYIADRYGRRVMLGINLLLFTLGSAICALSPSYLLLAVGRAIVGFGLGGEISVAVTMLAEFCSSRFRGTAVGLVNVGAGGMGNFLAPAFGLLVYALFPGPDGWRWLFGVLALPALLIVFYRRLIPETPRYLVSVGKIDEANRVLSVLASGRLARGNEPAEAYITSDATTLAPPRRRVPVSEIFRGPFARRTIPVAVAIWMSYGAQITVLTLLPTILVAQGHTLTASLLSTMVIQFGSFLGALAASAAGYYMPRRLALTAGASLACLAALALGFVATGITPVLLLGAVFQFFVLFLNTTIWIYAPELYPTRIRGFGVAFILATGTAAGALTPILSGRLFEAYGFGGVFGLIALMYAIFAVSIRFSPETFGRPLEEVDVPAPTRAAEATA